MIVNASQISGDDATTSGAGDRDDFTLSPTSERRKPLIFDPEPAQRMVVVRRRRRRRSRKLTLGERLLNALRIVVLAFVVVFLLLKVTGHEHAVSALKNAIRSMLHPSTPQIHLPDGEVMALVVVAAVLIFTMPGVPARMLAWFNAVNRK